MYAKADIVGFKTLDNRFSWSLTISTPFELKLTHFSTIVLLKEMIYYIFGEYLLRNVLALKDLF